MFIEDFHLNRQVSVNTFGTRLQLPVMRTSLLAGGSGMRRIQCLFTVFYVLVGFQQAGVVCV